MDPTYKRIEELDAYLKESQEGRMKAEGDLREMRLKNLALLKEYAKSLEYVKSLEMSYFIAHDSFESALK